uniref:Cyclin dependent kinase 2 interacting protein n=1 Tax=Myotis lucifugus TaxID=59463 RepID=G1PZ79_MYOLU
MSAKTLGSATPRKPVLSVSARKIKDNAADWHNLIMKWETLNDAGFATANSIANMKISLLSKDKIELESRSPACDENAEQRPREYSAELDALCEELRATLDGLVRPEVPGRVGAAWLSGHRGRSSPLTASLGSTVNMPRLWGPQRLLSPLSSVWTKIQVKMEKLSSTTKGVCELENYHYGQDSSRPPLFHTWPTAHFYEASRRLSDMYGAELLLKRTIVDGLAHTADHDLSLTYLSLWLHQPYIQSNSRLLLESMLLE